LSAGDRVDDDELVFNGVDGSTGGYLYRPTPLPQLARAILGENFQGDALDELKYHNRQPDFGTIYGVDAEDLSQSGWALVSGEDVGDEVLEALVPLRRLRAEQAGDRYREFVRADGVRRRESKRDFLKRNKVGSALPANPQKVPYYVLLVGGPESIPFSFQYQLDVQYAVGRVAFDTAEEYRRYADAVVAGDAVDAPRTARLFGPRHPADRATQLSSARLIEPLREPLAATTGWDVDAVPPEQATKEALSHLLGGPDVGLLFTASHGVGFPVGHPRQRDAQGALVCQDWPGPLLAGGALAENTYLAGADVAELPRVGPRVMVSFACFGAGTPRQDDFVHAPGVPSPAIAESPFVARLPQRLLGHPSGGMLAFVGHVERAWACSFTGRREGSQHDVFVSALRAIMDGWRIGHGMECFDDRYSALTAELHDILDGERRSGDRPDEREMTSLWLETNDARSYTVLGDPAVRL
jgi:hypothetical protein